MSACETAGHPSKLSQAPPRPPKHDTTPIVPLILCRDGSLSLSVSLSLARHAGFYSLGARSAARAQHGTRQARQERYNPGSWEEGEAAAGVSDRFCEQQSRRTLIDAVPTCILAQTSSARQMTPQSRDAVRRRNSAVFRARARVSRVSRRQFGAAGLEMEELVV